MSELQLFATMTFPEIYERVLVAPLFRPFAERLVDRLQPHAGDSQIDVACGTGIVARVGRERLGRAARIVGVDVAPAMLAVARTADPSIDWREGNAGALPVDDGQRFAIVTCHQGLQFFPDKAAALREMRRVLSPGGRVGIATWLPLRTMPVAQELNDIAERYVGKIADSRYSFGDPDALKAAVIAAGFTDVRVDEVSHDVRFADGALFARLNAMAAIGMSEKGKTLSEAERAEMAGRIAADSQSVIQRQQVDGMCVFPLATNVAIGHV